MFLYAADKKAIGVSAGLLIGIGVYIIIEYVINNA